MRTSTEDVETDPEEPTGAKYIMDIRKTTGKRYAKRVLIGWSEGLELDISRIVVVRKE